MIRKHLLIGFIFIVIWACSLTILSMFYNPKEWGFQTGIIAGIYGFIVIDLISLKVKRNL